MQKIVGEGTLTNFDIVRGCSRECISVIFVLFHPCLGTCGSLIRQFFGTSTFYLGSVAWDHVAPVFILHYYDLCYNCVLPYAFQFAQNVLLQLTLR